MTHCIATRLAAAIALMACLCESSQAAGGLLGKYVGAGVGQANIRIDQRPGDIALGLKENHTAWKAFVGIRPLSIIGVEYAYMDFGQPTSTLGALGTSSTVVAQVKQRGSALMAVGYLPLPVPWLDVYAKAGISNLQTTLTGSLPGVVCVRPGCNVFDSRTSDKRNVWGIGTQVSIPLTDFALRAEYERYATSNGDPTLLTVALLWQF